MIMEESILTELTRNAMYLLAEQWLRKEVSHKTIEQTEILHDVLKAERAKIIVQ